MSTLHHVINTTTSDEAYMTRIHVFCLREDPSGVLPAAESQKLIPVERLSTINERRVWLAEWKTTVCQRDGDGLTAKKLLSHLMSWSPMSPEQSNKPPQHRGGQRSGVRSGVVIEAEQTHIKLQQPTDVSCSNNRLWDYDRPLRFKTWLTYSKTWDLTSGSMTWDPTQSRAQWLETCPRVMVNDLRDIGCLERLESDSSSNAWDFTLNHAQRLETLFI